MAVDDPVDQRLLNALQEGLSLVRRPFDPVAAQLGLGVDEVLRRIGRLRQAGVIREISPIFDTRSLGYQSTLVAACVPANRLDQAAAVVNAHPGVSHNYGREHVFNLWFTLGLPPDTRLGLERTVRLLGEMAQATSIRLMPTLRVFKIGMKLDMRDSSRDADADMTSGPFSETVYDESSRPAERLSAEDSALVRELQWDLPDQREPFDRAAGRLGMDVERVLEHAARLLASGYLRRVAAVLHHRTAGFGANGMGVWAAPADRLTQAGRCMAAFPEVTHCYQRPTYPDWPYNLFAMVHARDRAGVRAVVESAAEATGLRCFDILYSSRQYKKVRLRYFTPETRQWEDQVLAADSGR